MIADQIRQLLPTSVLDGFDLSGTMIEHKEYAIYIQPTALGTWSLTIETPRDFGQSFDNLEDAKAYQKVINNSMYIFEVLVNDGKTQTL
jgi:hypothetical protein